MRLYCKKVISFLLLLTFISTLIPQTKVQAAEFKQDDYRYVITKAANGKIHGKVTVYCNNENIVTAKIPAEVKNNGRTYDITSIGYSGFSNLQKLKKVVVPKHVVTIEDYAFRGSPNITKVSLPEGLLTIGAAAFECSKLKNCNFPSTLTDIAYYAFWGADLRKVTIPKGMTVINSNVFAGNRNLKTVKIPESVTVIDQFAFANCSKLKSINIPTKLTTFGQSALGGTAIEKIEIPIGVTTIENGLVGGCKKLKEVTLHSRITSIGTFAFSNCAIKEISIPDKVESIGIGAFYGSKLIKITIPKKVTRIENETFRDCTDLKSVELSKNTVYIGREAFQGCSSLKSIKLPDKLEEIGESAFCMSGLESITLPKKITRLGSHAFNSCEKLENIKFLGIMEYIDGTALTGTLWLTNEFGKYRYDLEASKNNRFVIVGNVLLGTRSWYYYKLQYEGQEPEYRPTQIAIDEEIVIPEGVTMISGIFNDTSGFFSGYFYSETGAISIKLPSSLKIIGYSALASKSIKEIKLPDGLKTIGRFALQGTGITSIKIPSSVTEIGDEAFADSGLTSVTVPDTVKSLGANIFRGCTGLKKAVIKAKVDVINELFTSCSSLEEIVFPDTARDISGFEYCDNLKSITLPDNVEHLAMQQLPVGTVLKVKKGSKTQENLERTMKNNPEYYYEGRIVIKTIK